MNVKLILKFIALALVVGVLLGVGVVGWASIAATSSLARTIETHAVDFPIPFPLTAAELADLGIAEDVGNRIALERARDRGRHLVEARYGCTECHGRDFSGGVMLDAPPVGRILGPNLTYGEGSAVVGYRAADWDRIVRHGVKRDGTPAAMPSQDYQLMSDQELSDIVAYVTSRPPMVGEVPPVTYGPVGRVMVATGRMPLSADLIPDHGVQHAVYPPRTEVSVDFGRHLAGVCTGCHGADLAGGPIGGDPSWAPARNITPHADGIADWSYDEFKAALREGRRPDGTEVLLPMTLVMPYAQAMTDVELEALWTYLRSVEPLPNGE